MSEDLEGRVAGEWVDRLRSEYHPPADTPRDEMWAQIAAKLEPRERPVISLDEARAHRSPTGHRMIGWAVAAAALVVLGVGIGRTTAPSAPGTAEVIPTAGGAMGESSPSAPLRVAALRHLQRSEGLLTMVRADGRSGRVDPQVGPWASALLGQTRLLLDRTAATDPTMAALLEDLELVLVQIIGTSELGSTGDVRASAEMSLTLDAIERHEVVPRIQALMPARPGLAGV